jgi:hypothetical protein
METACIVLAVISLITYIVATMMIYDFLKKRGKNVSFVFLRLFMISYAHEYSRITRSETGRTGYLFYLWIISINLALVFTLLAFFVF